MHELEAIVGKKSIFSSFSIFVGCVGGIKQKGEHHQPLIYYKAINSELCTHAGINFLAKNGNRRSKSTDDFSRRIVDPMEHRSILLP